MKEIKRKLPPKSASASLFLIEAALLIEDNYDEICDEFWYVYVKKRCTQKPFNLCERISAGENRRDYGGAASKRIFEKLRSGN